MKCIWKCNGPTIVKIFLKKENKVDRLTLFKSDHDQDNVCLLLEGREI